MAKKKKLSAKEQKRLRQEQMAQMRQQRGWQAPEYSSGSSYPEPDESFMAAVAPLLAGGNEEVAFKNIEKTMLNSDLWANEPEFAEIMFPPMETAAQFTMALQQRGLAEGDPYKLDEDEFEEIAADITAESISKLLTDELQNEILDALEALFQRLKRQGKQQKAAQVAFIQLALKNEEVNTWAELPLIHAIYQKGFEAAMQLGEVSDEITLEDKEGVPLYEQIESATQNPKIMAKMEKLVEKTPGLKRYLTNKVDEIWDEGVNTIFRGELDLGLFTDDELMPVAELMKTFLKPGGDNTEVTDEMVRQFVAELEKYLGQFLSPARLTQMKEDLETTLREEEVPAEFVPFARLLLDDLKEEDAQEVLDSFFVSAIMGELRYLVHLEEEQEAEE